MLSRLLVTLCALPAITGAAAAGQGAVVVPAAFSAQEGRGGVFWLASPFPARRQLLIDASQLKALVGKRITSISLRRNAGPTAHVAGRLVIAVALSNSGASVRRPSPVFAQNRGLDHRAVWNGKLAVPASPPVSGPAPWKAPFAVTITLAKPFRYTGRTLVVETETRGPSANSKSARPWWVADADVALPSGKLERFGTSCIASMPGIPAGVDRSSLRVGGTAVFTLFGGAHSGPALLLIGAREVAIDLTGLGAAGCWLRVDPLIMRAELLKRLPAGRHAQASACVLLPALASLTGAKLAAQWIVVDQNRNRLGLSVSNGVRATIGRVLDSDMAWIESSDPKGVAGRIISGRRPIVRIGFVR